MCHKIMNDNVPMYFYSFLNALRAQKYGNTVQRQHKTRKITTSLKRIAFRWVSHFLLAKKHRKQKKLSTFK